jgi:hypothetical protein
VLRVVLDLDLGLGLVFRLVLGLGLALVLGLILHLGAQVMFNTRTTANDRAKSRVRDGVTARVWVIVRSIIG